MTPSREDASATGLRAYGRLLRRPGVRPFFAAAIVARLPNGFQSLGIVLLVREVTGSFAVAGLAAAAAFAMTTATAAPLGRMVDIHGQRRVLLVREVTGSFAVAGLAAAAAFATTTATAAPLGRMVDIHGQRRVLLPTAAWSAAWLVALAAAGLAGADAWVLVALSTGTGVTPPVTSAERAVLAATFHGADNATVFTLESVLQEVVFIAGPLIATVAAAAVHPAAALVAAAVLGMAGTVWFTSTALARAWRAPHVAHRGAGAIASPAIRLLCVLSLLTAVSFTSFELAVTAFAREQDAPNGAGAILAVWAAGSAAGGLFLGARIAGREPERMLVPLALCCAVLFAPMALAPGMWAAAPLAALAGVTIAPLMAVVYGLVGRHAPEGMVTEAFAWLSVSFLAGFGVGAAVSGVIADGRGARTALAVAGVWIGLGAVVVAARRGTLAPGGRCRSGRGRA